MKHEESVGIGLSQHLVDCHVAAAGPEFQCGKVTLSLRQRDRAATATVDPRSRDQLADVLECPPVERRSCQFSSETRRSAGNGGGPVIRCSPLGIPAP
jgi:hypothetical protein